MRLPEKLNLVLFSSVFFALGSAGADNVYSQEVTSEALPEIVVTAQRRGEQSLVDVPISLSVYSEADIKAGSFSNVDALAYAIPGLTAVSPDGVPGSRQFQIRGVSADVGDRSTVGYYWDEAPVNLGVGSAPDGSTLDVSRVEVLRGPQGTAFGQGSMGGTIRVITNKPDLTKFGGNVTVGLSQYDDGDGSWNAGLVLNAPLVEDVFGVRLAVKYDDVGGFVDNPIRGVSDINSGEQSQLRFKALWLPTDGSSVEFTYFQDRNDYDGRAIVTDLDAYNFGSLGREEGFADVDFFNVALDVELGFANLLSSTTYIKSDQLSPRNVDLGPLAVGSRTVSTIENTSKSTELRLVSNNDSSISWTVGGIYTEIQSDSFNDIFSLSLAPTVDPAGSLAALGLASGFTQSAVTSTADLDLKLKSWALFGEVMYKFTDRLSGTFGLRYYDSEFDGENATTLGITQTYFDPGLMQIASPFNPSVVALPAVNATPEGSDNDINPKISLSYAINEDANAYISAAKGFRSGGVNTILTAPNPLDPLNPFVFPAQYDSESLWTFEIGAKAYLFDSRLYVDGAIYYTDWTDIQSSNFPPGSTAGFVDNGGKASVKGFDGNITYLVTEDITFGGSISYTDSEYDFTGLNVIDGDPLPNVPEWSGSASLTWRPDLTDKLSGLMHIVYSYQDESFKALRSLAAAGLDPIQQMDEVSLVNLRVGLESETYGFGIYLYSTNLTDERGLAAPADLNITQVLGAAVIEPRVVGLEINFNF